MIKALALAAAATVFPLAASAAIVVEQPQVRASLGAQPTTAAYMTLRNTGAEPDRLLGVTCACSAMVMAHRSTVVNGISRMSMENTVTIPANGTVVFTPGGLHLMLTGVKRPIAQGAKVPMVLEFERAGRVAATFMSSATAGMAVEVGRQGR
jgi:copper(I)-binding protein